MGFVCLFGFCWVFVCLGFSVVVFVDLVNKINFETFSFQQLLIASFAPILASKCEN